MIGMAERVSKEKIDVVPGWHYTVDKDGYVYREKKGIFSNVREKVSSKKIKKEQEYYYFIDKDGYIAKIGLEENFGFIPGSKDAPKAFDMGDFMMARLGYMNVKYKKAPLSAIQIKKQEKSLKANSTPETEEKIRKYLNRGEKVLCSFVYTGGKEFGNAELLSNMWLEVLFVATDKRVMKIRETGKVGEETIDEIEYSSISSVHLDNLYGQSYYQIAWQAYKKVRKVKEPVMKGNRMTVHISLDPPVEETQFFEVKPTKWRILNVTNPEVKEFIEVVKSHIKNKKPEKFKIH